MKQTYIYQELIQLTQYEHFTLQMSASDSETIMTMCMSTPIFHTCDLPATYIILKKLLPSIFSSKCFNDNKYTFTKEVKNTEVGHLFEHILLEYLCIEKLNLGYTDAVFNGVTNWNWIEDPRGTFYIHVDAGLDKQEIISLALERSVQLLNIIMDSKEIASAVYN